MNIRRVLPFLAIAFLLLTCTGSASATTFPAVVTNVAGSDNPIVTQFVAQLATTLRSKVYTSSVTVGPFDFDGDGPALNYRVTEQITGDHTVVIAVVTVLRYNEPDGSKGLRWLASDLVYVSDNGTPDTISVTDAVQDVVGNVEKYIPTS